MSRFQPRFILFAAAFITLLGTPLTGIQTSQGAILIVTNIADSGPGSLRDTVAAASSGDTIQFDPALNGQEIILTSASIGVVNVTIDGPGPSQLTVRRSDQDGTPAFPIFETDGESVISGLTISNGNPGIVAGHRTLTIANCAITGNSSDDHGGGIATTYGTGIASTVAIVNSTISGNSAPKGGGIYNSGGFSGLSLRCDLTITNTSIFGNTASSQGGGIYNLGGLTITNSTISGNSANEGGGIENTITMAIVSEGVLAISNSTIANNSANGGGGGIDQRDICRPLRNTIIALNTSPDGPDVKGSLPSDGFNLIGNNSGVTISSPQPSDQIGTPASPIDPLLGPLQNNGGPTLTHALLPGSPAIDQGESSGSITDQRNFKRPVNFPDIANAMGGDDADIGAFEAAPAIFANISTRLRVQTDDNAMIGGFIITGTQPKTVIVRGIGPSLPVPGALADPVIEVHGASGELLATNDNWGTDPNMQHVIDSGLAPTNILESVLWGIINPGAYTVVVRGKNNTTGVGLFEVYDLDQTVNSKLANISTRGFVETGNNVLIGGTIVIGAFPASVLFRAIGPSLTSFGVTNALQDPTLELRDGNGALLESNDNWRSDHEFEIIATGIPPTNDFESAILQDLTPGNYTAIVRGVGDTTGVAVVEAYELN